MLTINPYISVHMLMIKDGKQEDGMVTKYPEDQNQIITIAQHPEHLNKEITNLKQGRGLYCE